MRSLFRRWSLGVHCLAGALLLTGCSSPEGPSPGLLDGLLGANASTPTVAQEPDKPCGTPAQCKGVLKTMINSPDRGWIGKRQSPDTYANGTRLFAYRALRKRLTCNELALAVEEMRAASQSLGRPVPGMAPEQASRTRALSTEVWDELSAERAGRCRS